MEKKQQKKNLKNNKKNEDQKYNSISENCEWGIPFLSRERA